MLCECDRSHARDKCAPGEGALGVTTNGTCQESALEAAHRKPSMCKPALVDAVQVVAEMPLDKVPAETVRPTAEETTRTEKAEAQVAEVKQVVEDGKPIDYPVTTGKIMSLSSQERPALLVGLILRIISEGTGMVMPLILAEAYDAVVDGLVKEEEPSVTQDTLTRVFIIVLSLHVAGNVLGFLAGCATGVAGERVVSRLRRRLYDHLLTQEMGFFDSSLTRVRRSSWIYYFQRRGLGRPTVPLRATALKHVPRMKRCCRMFLGGN